MAIKLTNRAFLNKIFWDNREDPRNYVLTFVHRGDFTDRRMIPLERIKHLEPSGFIYDGDEGETFIPYHRIIEVKDIRDGRVVWFSRRTQTKI